MSDARGRTRTLFRMCLLASCLASCTETTRERPARERGAELFEDPTLGGSAFNEFSCATCHSASADEGGRVFPGLPLENAAARTSFWNGDAVRLLDAVNFCLVFFMRGEALAPGEPKGDALYEFLASLAGNDEAPGVPLTFARKLPAVPRGDAARGAAVYAAGCLLCHGEIGSGEGRLDPLAPALGAQLSREYDERFPGVEHDRIVVEKVRHGAFYGAGGTMPPFALERLPDAALGDLLAFLSL